jgi:putative transposase
MAKQARRRGMADWEGLIGKQAASGISVARFCAREGLSVPSFYYWRSRLSRAPAPSAPAGDAFVDLGALGGGSRIELRVDLGGGVVVQIVRG